MFAESCIHIMNTLYHVYIVSSVMSTDQGRVKALAEVKCHMIHHVEKLIPILMANQAWIATSQVLKLSYVGDKFWCQNSAWHHALSEFTDCK